MEHSRPVVCYVQGTAEVGGSDIALLRLVSRLDRLRYEPLVVLPASGVLADRLRAAGVRVMVLPMPQLRSRLTPRYVTGYLARFWPTVWRLAGVLRRERVSLVHTNSLYVLYGAWAAALAGRPHVWHVREIPEGVPRHVLTWMARLLSRRVIAMTRAVAAMFPPASAVVTVADGIDLDEFSPSVAGTRVRAELDVPPDRLLVTFVGRLDPWKGAHVFVQAAARVASRGGEADFLVCGGELPGYEAYATSLCRAASASGARLHLTGWRFRLDDIPEVMAASDVVVHASVRPEPFGLVLIEAMAAGRPVVAARGGGVCEVVSADTAIVVPPDQPDRLADAILALLGDRLLRERMGRAGRCRAEAMFDVGQYARKIESLYDGVLGAGRA